MMEEKVMDKTLSEVAEGIAERIREVSGVEVSPQEVCEEMEQAGGITLGMLMLMSEPLDD